MCAPVTARLRREVPLPPAEMRPPGRIPGECLLWSRVLLLALDDAVTGGGTRTPMEKRPEMQAQARQWFCGGWWRNVAAAAGLDPQVAEPTLARLGLLPGTVADPRAVAELRERLRGRCQ